MTLTTQDALSMLKNRCNVLHCSPMGIPTINPELQAFLISALEDYERVVKDAERFQRALTGYRNGCIQSSDRSGYVDVFLEAIDAQITKEQA